MWQVWWNADWSRLSARGLFAMREEECEAIEDLMCGLLEVQWVVCCDCVIDADLDLGFRGLSRQVQYTK